MRPDVVVVTGVGFRSGGNDTTGTALPFESAAIKPNIGAWVARLLAERGYSVIMVARTEEKLRAITCFLNERIHSNGDVRFAALDLLDEDAVAGLFRSIEGEHSVGVVHSAGLSAGSYGLQSANPYLPIEKTPQTLPILETESVISSLLSVLKGAMPQLRSQGEARVVVVSSMSGVRPFALGFSHASAKAALHHAIRSAAIELGPLGIYISEIAPGIVDTGLYDSPEVQSAVRRIAEDFGRSYSDLPFMTPEAVAEAVVMCLESDAHILEVNMVARGQWPHARA